MPVYVDDPENAGVKLDVIELQKRTPFNPLPPFYVKHWLRREVWTRREAIKLLAGYEPDRTPWGEFKEGFNQIPPAQIAYLDGTTAHQLYGVGLVHPLNDDCLRSFGLLADYSKWASLDEKRTPKEWIAWAAGKDFQPYWLDWARTQAPIDDGTAVESSVRPVRLETPVPAAASPAKRGEMDAAEKYTNRYRAVIEYANHATFNVAELDAWALSNKHPFSFEKLLADSDMRGGHDSSRNYVAYEILSDAMARKAVPDDMDSSDAQVLLRAAGDLHEQENPVARLRDLHMVRYDRMLLCAVYDGDLALYDTLTRARLDVTPARLRYEERAEFYQSAAATPPASNGADTRARINAQIEREAQHLPAYLFAGEGFSEEALKQTTLSRYLKFETWTPLWAALLVSGIQPPQGCTEIPPNGAMGLSNNFITAIEDPFHQVRWVLELWNSRENPPARVRPADFVAWCKTQNIDTAWLSEVETTAEGSAQRTLMPLDSIAEHLAYQQWPDDASREAALAALERVGAGPGLYTPVYAARILTERRLKVQIKALRGADKIILYDPATKQPSVDTADALASIVELEKLLVDGVSLDADVERELSERAALWRHAADHEHKLMQSHEAGDTEHGLLPDWFRRDNWTPDEAFQLLLGTDPSSVVMCTNDAGGDATIVSARYLDGSLVCLDGWRNANVIEDMLHSEPRRIIYDLDVPATSLELLGLSASLSGMREYWDSGDHAPRNPPAYYVDWAQRKGFDIGWLEWARGKGLLSRGAVADGDADDISIAAPLGRQRAQEQAILLQLGKLGIDPRALPRPSRGKAGAKAAARSVLLKNTAVFQSKKTFELAWERLRASGEIQDDE